MYCMYFECPIIDSLVDIFKRNRTIKKISASQTLCTIKCYFGSSVAIDNCWLCAAVLKYICEQYSICLHWNPGIGHLWADCILSSLHYSLHILLVSTHVVCERLSAMQQLARLPEFLVQNSLSTPLPNENLDRSWHFGFELVCPSYPPPAPPQIKIWADFGILDFSWSGLPPLPPTGSVWRLIAVSPKDTVLLVTLFV